MSFHDQQHETYISPEHALAILHAIGREDEHVCGGEYFLRWDDSGREYLVQYGIDEPIAYNRTTRSWIN